MVDRSFDVSGPVPAGGTTTGAREACASDRWGRVALDHLPAVVSYWDVEMRCRFANPAFARWFGLDPQTIVGKHASELLGPLFPLNRPLMEAALAGSPQEFERRMQIPADGPVKYYRGSYVPDIVDGAVRGVVAHGADISAHKQIELTLAESEERFRLTLEEAPIGMATIAPDGTFERVNRALCEIVGYTAQELVGMTFQSITHPDDLGTDLALAQQLARGEIPRYSMEKRYVRKDGRVVDVELSASVVRGPDGLPRHFIAQVENIGERKRLDREHQFFAELGPALATTLDEDAIFQRVVDLATSQVADFCIIDLAGDSRTLRKVVACRNPADQVVAHALWPASDTDQPYLLAECIRTRRPVLVQRPGRAALAGMMQSEEHVRMVESLGIVSLVAVPLVAGERLVGAIALIASRDSREYDARDLRLAEELAWRTAIALENARLYRVAQQAVVARDEVLAIVAHDLRSPLSVIAMQAALLQRRSPSSTDKNGRAGETIQRALTQMRRLINDLLDVTRIEAGHLSVEQAPVDTNSLLHDIMESQWDVAGAASVALRLEAADDLPPVCADRLRISQVFENLVGNAVKFAGAAGTITIAARSSEKEVQFSVRDSGKGIPPEDVPHLFDRFWQARRADREGAGLGLPIVKGIVEAHGGRIWVDSGPDAGACFHFTVPRPPDAADGPPAVRPAGAGGFPSQIGVSA